MNVVFFHSYPNNSLKFYPSTSLIFDDLYTFDTNYACMNL